MLMFLLLLLSLVSNIYERSAEQCEVLSFLMKMEACGTEKYNLWCKILPRIKKDDAGFMFCFMSVVNLCVCARVRGRDGERDSHTQIALHEYHREFTE